MSLTYLSGDEIGRAKHKTAAQKAAKKQKRKGAFKRVTKKIKKVAVGPARGAFLAAVELNVLKLAKKMARTWNQPGGKHDIQVFWEGLGGDINKLKKAISKGSKQQISGDSVGIAVASVIAIATPIIKAIIPLFKKHKAMGDAKEAKEFDQGVTQGVKDLAADPTVPESTASMPASKDVGLVTDPSGNPVTDPNHTAPETKSGGYDGDTPPAESDGKTLSPADQEEEAKKTMSSTWSPLGFFFMLLLYSTFFSPSVVSALIQTWCIIGLLCIPFALQPPSRLQRVAYLLSYRPFLFLTSLFARYDKTTQGR